MDNFCRAATSSAYAMDLVEKSIPVTCAPLSASLAAYNPGPQPKSAIVVSLPTLKRETIHATARSMHLAFRRQKIKKPPEVGRLEMSIYSTQAFSMQSTGHTLTQ